MSPQPRDIARYWLAAAECGFAQPSDWQAWADSLIMLDTEPPETWLIDLAAAATADALKTWSDHHGMSDDDCDKATLGYLWHRYRNGSLSLGACLAEVGEAADHGHVGIECESFYALLNELESKGDSAAVARSAHRLCSGCFEIARAQLRALSSGT
ncbi:MAG: hypothetical protein AAF937_05900 [Planctomycetota bacterium]